MKLTQSHSTLEAELNKEKETSKKAISDLDTIVKDLKISDETSKALITKLKNDN